MDERNTKLMKLARDGSVAAFEELIQPHHNNIYSLMFRTCSNEFEASQLAQEVFTRVFCSAALWNDYISLTLNIYRTAEEITKQEISKQATCKSKMIS